MQQDDENMMQCFAQQSNEMIDQPSEQHFIDDEDEEAENEGDDEDDV